MKTYIVIAYRWGYINEQCTLFASENLEHCKKVAEDYPEYRGGKYGCAICESPTVEQYFLDAYDFVPLFYYPSMMGEEKPFYNHRCDVFNVPVGRITSHERYDWTESGWVKEIIQDAERVADRMNGKA